MGALSGYGRALWVWARCLGMAGLSEYGLSVKICGCWGSMGIPSEYERADGVWEDGKFSKQRAMFYCAPGRVNDSLMITRCSVKKHPQSELLSKESIIHGFFDAEGHLDSGSSNLWLAWHK